MSLPSMTKKICVLLTFAAFMTLSQWADAQLVNQGQTNQNQTINQGATIIAPGGAMRTPDGQILNVPGMEKEEPQGPTIQVKSMKCFSDRMSGQDLKFSVDGGFQFEGVQSEGEYRAELKDGTFPEDQLTQYFEFDFGPEAAGKAVQLHVTSAKTTAGYGLTVLSLNGNIDEKGILAAHWNINGSWPVGLYQVFFACEGKEAGGMGYRVKAVRDRESRISSIGVRIFVLGEKGDYIEKTALKPSDKSLIIECATSGVNTRGVDVLMYLEKEKEGRFEKVPNSETSMPEWPLEDTRLVYTIETPVAFLVGNYRMVFAVNGRKLAEHPFTVQD